MPWYTIHHSCALSDAQRDELARRITALHTSLFATPAQFVNVSFDAYAAVPHYVGGRRRTGRLNLITAQTRPGPSRGQEHYEKLTRGLEQAWVETVQQQQKTKKGEGDGYGDDDDDETTRFGAAFVYGSIVAAYELGFVLPQAGHDAQWIGDNLSEFRRRADAGDVEMADMLEELRGREEFKALF